MNINDKNIITLKDGWDFYIPKVKSDEKDNDLVNKIRSLVDLLYVPIPKKANNKFRIPKKVLPLYLNDCAQPYNTQLTHSLGILRNENNEKIFLEEINYLNGRLENQFTFDIRDQFEFSTYLNDAYFNNWITETELSEESRLLCEDSIKIFEDAYEIIKEKFPDAPFFKSATKINVLFFENNGLPYQARYPNHIDIASNKWVEDSKERRELLALHEVFHIVQFNLRSYSHVARNWFLEGTASWLETHKYKAVSTINKIDDYFESSHKNLEISSYGTLVFWMFIEDLLKKEGEKNPIFQYIDTIIEVAPPEEGKFVLMPALKLLIQRLNPALNFDLVFFDFAKKFIQIDWRAKIGVRSSRDELAYYNFNFTTDEFILDAYASFLEKLLQ
jgi:hypothetical protein